MEGQERKNRIIAVTTSLGIHLALAALFLFVMGFTAPNPPLSELGSGVELQLGLDESGGGDVQQEVPITPADQSIEAKTEELQKQEAVQETKEQPAETKPSEELSSEEESPVAAKQAQPEKKVVPDVKVINQKPTEAPETETRKPAVKKEEKKVVAKENGTAKEGTDHAKASKGISQGDDKGKTGDKGSPEGSLDPNAQYKGNAGNGNGAAGGGGISMTGFVGFERPKITAPDVPEDSYGTYEFSVKVNSDGEIVKITPKTRGLSLEAEKIFKKLIENTEFIPTNSNLPAFSEGTITFKIVAGKKN